MTNSEITASKLIIEAIEKIVEKYQKKAEKERAKINSAKVTYKGEVYKSEAELQEAYACDAFSSETYDRLLDKLMDAKDHIDKNDMTESEKIVFSLQSYRTNLMADLAWDAKEKEKKEAIDKRMRELVAEGYSIREAETIIGNEELMRFE